jgi:hypothetical protein
MPETVASVRATSGNCRKTRDMPTGEPTGLSKPRRRFMNMLRAHMIRGTRPEGSPSAVGRCWTVKDFASRVGVSEKTVRNWRNGETCPDDLLSIERVCTLL